MNLIMQSKHHQMMLLDERELFLIHRIIGKELRIVRMVIERRFMRDDQVIAALHRLTQNIHRIQKRRRNARHNSIGIADLDRIHCIRRRSRSVAMLYAGDRFACTKTLRERRYRQKQQNG